MMRTLIVGVLLMVNSSSCCITNSGTSPPRTATSCPMETVKNGQVSFIVTPTVTCNSGYLKVGPETSNRQCDGTSWSGTADTCVAICPAVTVANSQSVSYSSNNKEEGSTVSVTCATNYVMIAGEAERTCQADGTWSGTPQVCSKTCPALSADNARISYSSPHKEVGSTVTITCDSAAVKVHGGAPRTCQEDGTWDGTQTKCSLTCPEVSTVANAEPPIYSPEDRREGGSMTMTCSSGFVITSGNETRRCGPNIIWDGSPPVCEALTCPEGSTVPNAEPPIYSPEDRRETSTMTVTCSIGFVITSGDETRRCGPNLQWDGSPPVCEAESV